MKTMTLPFDSYQRKRRLESLRGIINITVRSVAIKHNNQPGTNAPLSYQEMVIDYDPTALSEAGIISIVRNKKTMGSNPNRNQKQFNNQ